MKIIVIKQVPHEHLGTLSDTLRKHNLIYEYINSYENKNPDISLINMDGLIILGGPMNVYETDKYPFLEMEDKLIKKAIEKDIPVLGICLGAQLIAKALGSRVKQNTEKEIGWYSLKTNEEGSKDMLLKHCKNEEIVFQWHGDTFEIPRGAVHLAYSPLCTNQAFRYGSKVYGLQFHIEVTHQMILEWLDVSENLKELESLEASIDPTVIKADIPKYINRLHS
ncbi:MAG TPA: type 1 glutamine amidotransferase, partial [Thermodesulfobacteriota bacterium]